MSIKVASKRWSGTGNLKSFFRTGTQGADILPLTMITTNLIDYWVPLAANVTKDGNNRVSNFVGLNGNSFAQSNGSYQPLWGSSGKNGHPYIYEDACGAGRYLLCNSITQAKPFTAYLLLCQKVYTGGQTPIVQFGVNCRCQQNGASPAITLTDVTTAEASNTGLTLNSFKVATLMANTSSPNESIQVGTNTPQTNNGSNLSGVDTTSHKIYCGGWSLDDCELYAYALYSGIHSASDVATMLNFFKSNFGTDD